MGASDFQVIGVVFWKLRVGGNLFQIGQQGFAPLAGGLKVIEGPALDRVCGKHTPFRAQRGHEVFEFGSGYESPQLIDGGP
jgi:hypothetical protein